MSSNKNEAFTWLKVLREGREHQTAMGCIRRYLQAGGLTLADIGTTEEELEQLMPKAA